MSRVMDAMKRAVRGSETVLAGPAPIDLKAQYIEAVTQLISAGRRFDRMGEVYHWRARLHEIHHRAEEDGHVDAMAAVWVEPPVHLNPEVLNWYEAATNHALHGGPAPGERPLHPYEPEYWFARYRALVTDFLRARRSGDRAAAGRSANLLGQFPRLASVSLGDKTDKVLPHFGPHPTFVEGEAALVAWEEEVDHRLLHGTPSGRYVPPQMPAPFLRRVADELTHSAVVLLASHGSDPLGARVVLNAGISHELVEAGRATWCAPESIPEDPRPPVEREPEADWRRVTFRRRTRTASRHVRQEGEVVALPPDEADEMVRTYAAEFWVPPAPPPPPPPRPVTVFGAADI